MKGVHHFQLKTVYGVVSAMNGVYQVKSSLGNFSVNVRKGTITKK